jgi:hypothetical protein
VISAVEALRLPIAALTAEQRASVSRVLELMERHVVQRMSSVGVQFEIYETDGPVIGAVTTELRRLGWNPRFMPLMKPSAISGAQNQHVGFTVVLIPSDAAIDEADRLTH